MPKRRLKVCDSATPRTKVLPEGAEIRCVRLDAERPRFRKACQKIGGRISYVRASIHNGPDSAQMVDAAIFAINENLIEYQSITRSAPDVNRFVAEGSPYPTVSSAVGSTSINKSLRAQRRHCLAIQPNPVRKAELNLHGTLPRNISDNSSLEDLGQRGTRPASAGSADHLHESRRLSVKKHGYRPAS